MLIPDQPTFNYYIHSLKHDDMTRGLEVQSAKSFNNTYILFPVWMNSFTPFKLKYRTNYSHHSKAKWNQPQALTSGLCYETVQYKLRIQKFEIGI